ncbi:hypothetical protein DFJ74DRAFT_704963 [Hyaloraphidium curvatum]|nr:hypothetical protein DFJ74DRAFT_704963 [Hyaloraphidium curvatum]
MEGAASDAADDGEPFTVESFEVPLPSPVPPEDAPPFFPDPPFSPPAELPDPFLAFPAGHAPRDPARTRVTICHDLTADGDDALRFALERLYLPKDGEAIDLLAVCALSDAVLRRAGGKIPSLGLFRRRDRSRSRERVGETKVEEMAELFPKEPPADSWLYGVPTPDEERVGAALEERVAKVVREVDAPFKIPISIAVLPHGTSTLHTLLSFFGDTRPSLVVLASRGHTSGIVDTLVHGGVGKGVMTGWDGPVCLVRRKRGEERVGALGVSPYP